MAKRVTGLNKRKQSHSPKTAKRLAVKKVMMTQKKAQNLKYKYA